MKSPGRYLPITKKKKQISFNRIQGVLKPFRLKRRRTAAGASGATNKELLLPEVRGGNLSINVHPTYAFICMMTLSDDRLRIHKNPEAPIFTQLLVFLLISVAEALFLPQAPIFGTIAWHR